MLRTFNTPGRALVAVALLALFGGCDKGDSGTGSGGPSTGPSTATTKSTAQRSGGKPRIAYVTNGVDPFWTIAAKGANDGAAEFNADVTVIFPSNAEDQQRKIEDVLIGGIDGIAISPIDAKNQTPMIDQAARKTNLITHDSDAPESIRLMYIGMDNYRSEEHTSELQSHVNIVCRLLLEKKK